MKRERNILYFIKASLLALCVLGSFSVSSQEINCKVNKDSVLIGEPIEYRITYPLEGITSNLLFSSGDSIGDGFEVLAVLRNDTIQGFVYQDLQLVSFEDGNRFIAPMSVFYGDKKVISTPIPVTVSLVKADTTLPFKDIKPIIEDPLTAKDKFNQLLTWIVNNWLLVLIALLVIGVLSWFLFFRKKKEKEVIEPIKEIIPAHILANKKLKELEEQKLWQNGKQKQYNVELTEIVQFYISQRYEVPTSEKTSSEILHSLRFIEMGDQNKDNLRKLLTLSDLVKFAKEQPTAQENEQVLQEAYQFIETTKQS